MFDFSQFLSNLLFYYPRDVALRMMREQITRMANQVENMDLFDSDISQEQHDELIQLLNRIAENI